LKARLDAKKKKTNNTQDALIAEVAIVQKLTLVTSDNDLADTARELRAKVLFIAARPHVGACDLELINQAADELNTEAEDGLRCQSRKKSGGLRGVGGYSPPPPPAITAVSLSTGSLASTRA